MLGYIWKRLSKVLVSDWGLYISRFAIVGMNFLSLLIIAFVMETENFGRFVFMWSATVTLAAIISIGGPALLLREFSANKGSELQGVSLRYALRLGLLWPMILMLCLGVGLQIAAPLIQNIGDGVLLSKRDMWLVLFASFALHLFNVLAVPLRVASFANLAMGLRDAGPQLAMTISALLLFLRDEPTPEMVFSLFFVIAGLILACGVLALVWSLKDGLFVSASAPKTSKSVWGFWGTTVTNVLWSQIDILVGGLFLSAAELGVYQIIKRIANLAALPQIIGNWAVVVRVGRAYATRNIAEIARACRRAIELSFPPMIILVVSCLISFPLVRTVFDLPDIPVFWIVLCLLLAGSASNVAFGANFSVASQCHLEKIALLARLLGIALTTAMVLSISGAGIAGVAVATLLGMLVSNVVLWMVIWKKFGVDTSVFAVLSERMKVV